MNKKNYVNEINKILTTALNELAEQLAVNKVQNTPVSKHNFLGHWLGHALKKQRFSSETASDLKHWQKQFRSQGNRVNLDQLFTRLHAFYQAAPTDKIILDSDIEQILDGFEALGWQVTTSESIVGHGKIQIFSEGKSSLVLCSQQCDDSFAGDELTQPMNWFVRGDQQQFIEQMLKAGVLVHKIQEYKSSVKYHGEYIIFPSNRGDRLAEIPCGFISA